MKPEVKKWIIVGGLGVISIALAAAYLQYKKLMDYCISFKGIKLKNLSLTNVDFDIFLGVTNKSDIKFVIKSQEYTVYLNNNMITKITGASDTIIAPKSLATIPLNIKFNPKDIGNKAGSGSLGLLANLGATKVKIDIKLKVSLLFFTVSVPYIYETTLKELTAPSPKNESTQNKESKKCI